MGNLPKQPLQNVLEEGQGKIQSGISIASVKKLSSEQQPNEKASASEKRVAANRMNALKSTGPKTGAGKVRSSLNALKHGMLSDSPVIPGMESEEAWEEHRKGILDNLKPVGYLEELFATRIAIEFWKMGRSVRYQAQVAETAVSAAPSDLAEQKIKNDFVAPRDPAKVRQQIEDDTNVIDLLTALPTLHDGEDLERAAAVPTMWALFKTGPYTDDEIFVPGLPENDIEFDDFDNWTAGLLRTVLEVYAQAAQMSADELREKCIGEAIERRDKASEEERGWNLSLERERRIRAMLDPRMLDSITRYETGCERSLFKNLHAFERLQAARGGAFVSPPETIELDLTVDTTDVDQTDSREKTTSALSTQGLILEIEAGNTVGDQGEIEVDTRSENPPELNGENSLSRNCETNPSSCDERGDSVEDREIANCETKPQW